jgi:hypothetical protein
MVRSQNYIRADTSDTTRRRSVGQWPADVHVSAICFTLFTLNTCCSFVEDAPPWMGVPTVLTPGVPVISTCWPTCLVSLLALGEAGNP